MTEPQVDKTEFVERTQDHLNHYIAAADTKASILLTGHLAFLGLYGNAVRSEFVDPTALFLIFAGLTVGFVLIASSFSLSVIYPRTPETPTGYILWSSILEMGEEKYREEMQNLDPDTAFQELADENYALSIVADKKYASLRRSLIATFIMVGFALLSFAIAVS